MKGSCQDTGQEKSLISQSYELLVADADSAADVFSAAALAVVAAGEALAAVASVVALASDVWAAVALVAVSFDDVASSLAEVSSEDEVSAADWDDDSDEDVGRDIDEMDEEAPAVVDPTPLVEFNATEDDDIMEDVALMF